jgi:hypothetical protein
MLTWVQDIYILIRWAFNNKMKTVFCAALLFHEQGSD